MSPVDEHLPPNELLVRQRVREINQLMNVHAGGVDLVGIDERGSITVAFTGMCTGCPLRPLTMAGTVRPGLTDVDGVSSVHAVGGRISDEAEARLVELLQGSPRPRNWWLGREPTRETHA